MHYGKDTAHTNCEVKFHKMWFLVVPLSTHQHALRYKKNLERGVEGVAIMSMMEHSRIEN